MILQCYMFSYLRLIRFQPLLNVLETVIVTLGYVVLTFGPDFLVVLFVSTQADARQT